jgi:predicted dehydrogenase
MNLKLPLELPYLPMDPAHTDFAIGMIGCGGITTHHLTAYRKAKYRVVALCDIRRSAAEARRDEFYPNADVYEDYRDLLQRNDIQVVDIATHPSNRSAIIQDALLAGKHVLSQKPFVLDLDEGEHLVELAEGLGLKLAVNQNARWAPHFSYLRAAVEAGLLGQLAAAHLSVHWDHSWVEGTEFERVRNLILYDYAIHWFDLVNCLFSPRKALRVCGTIARSPWQTIMPPLQGQALIEYDCAQVSLAFDGSTKFAPLDQTYVTGSLGTIVSMGPGNRQQQLTLTTEGGSHTPELQGCWFPDGFRGTMGELLRSIEEDRTPSIDARRNLDSLALCFAAVASADRHEVVVPGTIRTLP